LAGDLRTAVGKDMVGNLLAQGVAIEWSGYWQVMSWRERQQ